MRIIRPIFPEPPDVVLQGMTIGEVPLGSVIDPPATSPVLQGESPLGSMKGYAVPRAMIGWNPYFAQPPSIGPMAIQGGLVGMVPVGPAVPANPLIDPSQIFLNSKLPLDSTGAWFPNDVVSQGNAEPAMSKVLMGEAPLTDHVPHTNPLQEIVTSGLLKTITAPVMPDFFGMKVYPSQISYQRFALTGVTKDSAGAALGSCRVVAFEADRLSSDLVEATIAETVSDGSGNYSIPARRIAYQLTAYKPGSPDVAGITRNDVVPSLL